MMKIFDFNKLGSYSYKESIKNIFFKKEEFKTKIIELPSEKEMLTCERDNYLYCLFYLGPKGGEMM